MSPKVEVLAVETKAERKLFERGHELRAKYTRAMETGAEAIRLLLDFARDYYAAWQNAIDLPGTQQERNARVIRLNRIIGVHERSDAWISNIRSIGREARWLRTHVEHLPRSTDSLRLLAQAGEKKSVPLLRKGKVTDASSITETRAALGKRSKHTVARATTYDGHLSFLDEQEAVGVFASALLNTSAVLTLSDAGVLSALQAHLGRNQWQTVKDRVRVS